MTLAAPPPAGVSQGEWQQQREGNHRRGGPHPLAPLSWVVRVHGGLVPGVRLRVTIVSMLGVTWLLARRVDVACDNGPDAGNL
jgi:hypothetical protein